MSMLVLISLFVLKMKLNLPGIATYLIFIQDYTLWA